MTAPKKLKLVPAPAEGGLLRIAQSFPRRRVLVVGDFVADHYLYGQTDRISREAPVLVVRYESADVKLGGGANAAANAKALGGQVTAVGVLGHDEMGRALKKAFRSLGVAVETPSAAGLQTETKTRILAGGVHTTRQQMLRIDRGMTGPLPARVRMELQRLLQNAAKGADAILVSDYGSGVLNEETRTVLQKLAADGMPVCVDSRYALKDFTGFTVCKPNEPELEALTGVVVRTQADLLIAGKKAVKMLGCRSLLVTRGRNGMAVFDRQGNAEFLPVHGADEAVDVTGAGDTVIAAFTLALATGAPVLDSAQLANVAGSLVVMKPGTATISQDELCRELSK